MKTVYKMLAILVIAMCTLVIMPKNVSLADDRNVTMNVNFAEAKNNATKVTGILGKLLGFLQVVSGVTAVIVIAWTGFNFIFAGAEVKTDMLKKFLPIIIGLVLVFGATTVANFVISMAPTDSDSGSAFVNIVEKA